MSDWPRALDASPSAIPLARPSTWARIWLPAVVVLLTLYAGLPWLAPVFMHLGWTGGAELAERVATDPELDFPTPSEQP